MLFTNIQLNNFTPTWHDSSSDWRSRVHRKPNGSWWVLWTLELCWSTVKVEVWFGRWRSESDHETGGRGDDEACMGGEDEFMRLLPTSSPAMLTMLSAAGSSPAEDYPLPFKFTLQFTFSMLMHVLCHPTRKVNTGEPLHMEYSQPLFDHPFDILSSDVQAREGIDCSWTEHTLRGACKVPGDRTEGCQGLNVGGSLKPEAGNSER